MSNPRLILLQFNFLEGPLYNLATDLAFAKSLADHVINFHMIKAVNKEIPLVKESDIDMAVQPMFVRLSPIHQHLHSNYRTVQNSTFETRLTFERK